MNRNQLQLGRAGGSSLTTMQQRIGSANFCKWHVTSGQWYDTVRLSAAGTNRLQFFQLPIGTADPTSGLAKTLEQTNLTRQGSFGQTYMVAESIRVIATVVPKIRQNAEISGDALMITSMQPAVRLLTAMYSMGVMTVKLGSKDYFEIDQPLRTCPAGFGLSINTIPAPLTATTEWVQSNPSDKSIFRLTPVQMIEPEQTISVDLSFPNANTPDFNALADTPSIDIRVIFDGKIARPAQ